MGVSGAALVLNMEHDIKEHFLPCRVLDSLINYAVQKNKIKKTNPPSILVSIRVNLLDPKNQPKFLTQTHVATSHGILERSWKE